MKNKILLVLVPALMLCGCNVKHEEKYEIPQPKITSRKNVWDVPAYTYDEGEHKFKQMTRDNWENVPYHFFNGSSIPYVGVKATVVKEINYGALLPDMFAEMEVCDSTEDTAVLLNKATRATCTFSYKEQSITFSDYSKFSDLAKSSEKSTFNTILDGGELLFVGEREADVYDATKSITIPLSFYNIKMYKDAEDLYIPYMLIRNALIEYTPSPVISIFNGTGTYYYSANNNQENLNQVKQIKATGTIFDQEYANFSYDLLALSIDFNYGFRQRTFRTTGEVKKYMEESSYSFLKKYKDDLTSIKPNVSARATAEMFKNELDDGGHTSYEGLNFFSTELFEESYNFNGPERAHTVNSIRKHAEARVAAGYDPATITGNDEADCYYSEKDGVAFITFDSFMAWQSGIDKLPTDIDSTNYYQNTVTLVHYANEQIRAHNIKDVVIDLSANGGGMVVACLFIESWLGQGTAEFNTKSPLDNTFVRMRVHGDIDFDGEFTSNDYLPSDVRTYCIVSNGSFSCGNILPSFLKDYTNTKFIGSRSGGGCCSVKSNVLLPLGNAFRCSSFNMIGRRDSTQENFISNDDGVEADWMKIQETNYADFYDRTAIVNKIKAA